MKRGWLLISAAMDCWLVSAGTWAQCALCKATVESAQQPTLLSGLKMGILFLVGLPYLLAGLIGFLIARATRQNSVLTRDLGEHRS